MSYSRNPKSGTIHANKMGGTVTRCGKDAAYLAGGYESVKHAAREAAANGGGSYCGSCFPLAPRGYRKIAAAKGDY